MKIQTVISRQTFFKCAFVVLFFMGCTKSGSGNPEPVPPPPPAPPPVAAPPSLATVKTWLVDKGATDETAALFYNLKKVSKTGILFGHQDATKRGVTNATTQWANEQHLPAVPREKSDVKEVAGAYPAVYGHDFIHIANFEDGAWYDYERDIARQLTIDAYNRGGVNTFAWHYFNPVSKGSFYWKDSPTEAVSKIIPGGSHHDVYKASLKEIADFAKTLIGADGKLVPVIFRPFHEMDGDWFWWGKGRTSVADYKTLYRFTVTYLKDELGVHNFLYAWSPDRTATNQTQLLEWYPGDEYVDVVGMDNYWDLRTGTAPSVAAGKLKMVSDYAKSKNKVAALTETGLSKLEQADWYTAMLLKALQQQPLELAYVMVWANTKDAYWTPYKGHSAEANFKTFKASPYVLFGDEAPKMYEIK
ncbi:MAG: glycoside hydrolase family 26 protein [Chitinophagaceae bacterium]